MTLGMDSQTLDAFIPVYDVIPNKWEESREVIVEQLKMITNGVNIREIGWYLDEELLTGKSFIPGVPPVGDSSPPQYRQILRKVFDFSPLVPGVNFRAHGVKVDTNFTLIQLYAAGTNVGALNGEPIPNGADTITYDVNNIYITVAAGYTRSFCVMEYMQEL
jgi:hypothetical protein